MRKNREQEIAKRNLDDLRERGTEAIGGDVMELFDSLMTAEEIAESDLQASLICELVRARNEKGITQKQLEEMSGVRQPVIARIESVQYNPSPAARKTEGSVKPMECKNGCATAVISTHRRMSSTVSAGAW